MEDIFDYIEWDDVDYEYLSSGKGSIQDRFYWLKDYLRCKKKVLENPTDQCWSDCLSHAREMLIELDVWEEAIKFLEKKYLNINLTKPLIKNHHAKILDVPIRYFGKTKPLGRLFQQYHKGDKAPLPFDELFKIITNRLSPEAPKGKTIEHHRVKVRTIGELKKHYDGSYHIFEL